MRISSQFPWLAASISAPFSRCAMMAAGSPASALEPADGLLDHPGGHVGARRARRHRGADQAGDPKPERLLRPRLMLLRPGRARARRRSRAGNASPETEERQTTAARTWLRSGSRLIEPTANGSETGTLQ